MTPPPLTTLRGAGPAVAGKLARLGIANVRDLLLHLPLRYQDRCTTIPLNRLVPGEEATIEAEITGTRVRAGRRRTLLVDLVDDNEQLTLRFFHFHSGQIRKFRPGLRIRCFGTVRRGPGSLEMVHPDFEPAVPRTSSAPDRLTPVYPLTEGISQNLLRNLIDAAFDSLARGEWALPDWVPDKLLPGGIRIDTQSALECLHRPPRETGPFASGAYHQPARTRLAFEELLAQQLGLARIRHRLKRASAPGISVGPEVLSPFLDALPFSLTDDQLRVIGEIRLDLGSDGPMMRLVQGDVGSGKTVIAAAACLLAVRSGHQVALMAPTELLAEQHIASLRSWLGPLGISLDLLAGSQGSREREAALAAASRGETDIIVGTHALIQDGVRIPRLGLAVVDEQHRFGVHQRLALADTAGPGHPTPHQLIMTATPIPRTLAMTAYADLDHSVLKGLPPGRVPVNTVAIPDSRRDEVISRIGKACGAGRQAYWICTLVEESETLQCQAAEDTARYLADALNGVRIGLVHGRMRGTERSETLDRFRKGALQVLVATTVIEVGVDVPNASLMIIENPERLGLAQLHQIRGRIGRGKAKSDCVLLCGPRLSESARARIRALRECTDGFEIARIDLRLRGPGEVLGTRQTGNFELRVADLERDRHLIEDASRAARHLAATDPEAVDGLIDRWIGANDRYGHA